MIWHWYDILTVFIDNIDNHRSDTNEIGNVHYVGEGGITKAEERKLFGINSRVITILDVNAPGAQAHTQEIIMKNIETHKPDVVCLHESGDNRRKVFLTNPKIIRSNDNAPHKDCRNEMHVDAALVEETSGVFTIIVSTDYFCFN